MLRDPPSGRRPRRAIVLAAGFGERMQPISAVCPKPLLPIWGRPILGLVLDQLGAHGVEAVLINLHHGADAILRCARALAPAGMQLCFSYEPTILGTGGALRRAAWFIGQDPFWLCNGDVVSLPDFDAIERAFYGTDAIAAVWLHPTRGPRTVELTEGRIVSFRSARAGQSNTSTFCGVQLVAPRLLQCLPETERFSTLVEAYERAMSRGERVVPVLSNRWWADLGTPESYVQAHEETREAAYAGKPEGVFYRAAVEKKARRVIRRTGAAVCGWVCAGDAVRVGRGAHIERAVLLDGARVAAGAALRGTIVAGGATARGVVRGAIAPAAVALRPAEREALARLGWPLVNTSAEALPPRGSDRTFWRLAAPGRRAILVRYGTARPENLRYAGHARFLRQLGMPVPTVLADCSETRFTIFEDLGDESLAEAVQGASVSSWFRRYAAVAEWVAAWHVRVTEAARKARLAFEMSFGPQVYRYERALFIEHFLKGRCGIAEKTCRAIEFELRRVAHRLDRAPSVLLHRDLQASNILLMRGRPYFIDFQGMRFGPAMYDMASLLCDPYVEFPPGLSDRILTHYLHAREAEAAEVNYFWPAAIQRLSQALGAFARLSALPGGAHFADYIPRAVVRLREAIERCHIPLPTLERLLLQMLK